MNYDIVCISPKELRIIYHQIAENKIRFGAYFIMNVTVIFPGKHRFIYFIDGHDDWGIIGKMRAVINAGQEKAEILVRAIPIKYGRIAVPEIKIQLGDEDTYLEAWVSGNEQMVIVVPKYVVQGMPNYN